ncbi:carbonic anhydrase [bacterium]|nr:carbonic anhydrase [bacterium]
MDSMKKLVKGHHAFLENEHPKLKEEFVELAKGQAPEILLITCSDSRVSPELFLQHKPGEVFTIRNAGNIVPCCSNANLGDIGTIEFAVSVLGVKHIIVCGHSDCGAVKGMLNPEKLESLPHLHDWIVQSSSDFDIDEDGSLEAHIRQNVINQLNHLNQYDFISGRIESKELCLHGWIYDIESSSIMAHNAKDEGWIPLSAPDL